MRVQPVICSCKNISKIRKNQTQFEKRNDLIKNYKYTGVASADLAYASLLNKSIANDLRLMGLI